MGNMPAVQSFYIWQGQTFNDTVTLESVPGTPLDLTGYSAQLMVRSSMLDDPPLLELSTANGGILNAAPTTGVLQFNLTAAQTYALDTEDTQQNWTYDLFTTDATGATQNVMRGSLVVYPSATRPEPAPWWWWPYGSQPFPPLPGGPPQPAPPWYTSQQAVGWTTKALVPPPDYPIGTIAYPPPLDQPWPLPPSWPVGLVYPLPLGTPFPTLTPSAWWPSSIPYAPPYAPGNPNWWL